jgi:hypothetical protein
MSDKAALKKQIDSARIKLDRIEKVERREEAAKILGKCFRTRNSYSCPEKPSDYWWLYCRITSVGKDGDVRGFEFQTDNRGQIFIDPKKYAYRHMSGWEEISLMQFKAALKSLEDDFKAKVKEATKLAV